MTQRTRHEGERVEKCNWKAINRERSISIDGLQIQCEKCERCKIKIDLSEKGGKKLMSKSFL